MFMHRLLILLSLILFGGGQSAWASGKADLQNGMVISSAAVSGLVNSASDKLGARFDMASFNYHSCGPTPCDSAYDAGFWAETGYDYFYKTGAGRMKGGLFQATIGLDRRFDDDLIIGLAFSEEVLDLDLSGGRSLEHFGLTIMPYLGYKLSEDSFVDVSAGYSWLDNDLEIKRSRYSSISGDYHSWRIFTGGGYSKYWSFDDWSFSGRLGALYLHHKNSDLELLHKYSRRSWNLLQSQVSGKAIYNSDIFRPFAELAWNQDLIKSGPSDDLAGLDFDLGFDWDVASCAVLELAGTYGVREDLNRYGAKLAIKVSF